MISEIFLIDVYANTIDSMIHRCSYILKTLFTFLFLMLIIFSTNTTKIAVYILIVTSLILLSRLPFIKIMKFTIYAVIFGLIFALSQLFYSFDLALLTITKVFATTSLMIWYVTTTGFMPLFQSVPSRTLRNMLILSYRFFFMSVDNLTKRLSISKVRGMASASLWNRIKSLSNIVAHEMIHIIEKAERVHRIMILRGFNGKMLMPKKISISKNDWLICTYLIGVVIIWMI